MSTVTVACKLPNGLLLRVFQKVQDTELVMGGGARTIERYEQVGDTVKINGVAVAFGKMPTCEMAGGYALTHGVDTEFWSVWFEQNKSSMLVKNKIIFGFESPERAKRHAEANLKVKSGLEPLDPFNPPQGLRQIKPADEMKDRLTPPEIRERV